MTRSTNENPELAGASSLATTVGWLAEVPNTTSLPPTGVDMLEAYNVAPTALRGLLVADNGNATQVLFQVGPSSLEQRAVVLDKMHLAIANPGDGALLPAQASATTGGLAVVGVGLLKNITANRAQLTIVALLLVGVFVVLRYRDLRPWLADDDPRAGRRRHVGGARASAQHHAQPAVDRRWTTGGRDLCGVLGACSLRDTQRNVNAVSIPRSARRWRRDRTGRAFFTSALTTLGGFAVLMFSSLPLLADFGTVVTINIGVALLSALVVVPPLVKEADRRGLLAMGPASDTDRSTSGRAAAGWVAGALIARSVLGS